MEQIEGISILRPSGKLDATTAAIFDEAVDSKEDELGDRVIVDMTGVQFVSSAGLRVLLRLGKKLMASGKLALCNYSQPIEQILTLAGFERIMLLCQDLDDAKSKVNS